MATSTQERPYETREVTREDIERSLDAVATRLREGNSTPEPASEA